MCLRYPGVLCVLAVLLPVIFDGVQAQSGTALLQVKMGPFQPCPWVQGGETMGKISSFIAVNLAAAIEEACSCGFNVSDLQLPTLECDYTKTTYPTYRAFVNANSRYSVTDIVRHVEEWVASGPTITVGLVLVSVDSSCPVSPSLEDPICIGTGDSTCSVSVLVGSIIAEFVILVFIFAVIIAVFLIVTSHTNSKRKYQKKKRRRVDSTASRDSSLSTGKIFSASNAMHMQSCQAYAAPVH